MGYSAARYLPSRAIALLAICSGLAFFACQAAHLVRNPANPQELPESTDTSREGVVSTAASALTIKGEASPSRRILSIGDLHGDAPHAEELLRALGVMDEHGGWAGGNTVLIQTGDVVDRGDHSRQIYETLFRLQDEAPAQGGEVVLLLGNHELMHMQGETHYMSQEDASEFGGAAACKAAFGPAGWLGARLRTRNQAAALLGHAYGLAAPVVYVHAGITHSIASLVAAAAKGRGPVEALNQLVRDQLQGHGTADLAGSGSMLLGNKGPFWTRKLALGKQPCEDLQESLRVLNASRMIVGHTAQADGKVHQRCDGKLVLADTEISAAFTGTPHPSAVEVKPDGCAHALYPTLGRTEQLTCVPVI